MMRIPLDVRERLVDQVAAELAAVLPLAEATVKARLLTLVHNTETLHEFWRGKGTGRHARRQKAKQHNNSERNER